MQNKHEVEIGSPAFIEWQLTEIVALFGSVQKEGGLLTVDQARRLLCVSTDRVNELVRLGHLRALTFNGVRLLSASQVLERMNGPRNSPRGRNRGEAAKRSAEWAATGGHVPPNAGFEGAARPPLEHAHTRIS